MDKERAYRFTATDEWIWIKDCLAEEMVKAFTTPIRDEKGFKSFVDIGQQVVANNLAQEIIESFMTSMETAAEQYKLEIAVEDPETPLIEYKDSSQPL